MPNFILTQGQEKALKMAISIAKSDLNRPAIGVIDGVAGSGKTTLFGYIEKELGEVLIITFTGKAALRVSEATGLRASTIHRWCFKPHENPTDGSVYYSARKPEEVEVPPSRLIIIDEASMISLELWESIHEIATAARCNILLVGDNAQLPPITDSKEYFNLLDPLFKSDARIKLTEITRQALDSPIIKASFLVRDNNIYGAINNLPRVFDQDFIKNAFEVLDSNGVIICHTNKTRNVINQIIRKHKNYGFDLVDGEHLLVLRNTYGVDKYNGEVLTFNHWEHFNEKSYSIYDGWKKKEGDGTFGRASVDDCAVILCPEAVHGQLEELSPKVIEKVGKHAAGKHLDYLHCNFGYALTCAKSQGSEWDKVMCIVEPSVNISSTDGRKFLYTQITRAKKECFISWNPNLKDLQ